MKEFKQYTAEVQEKWGKTSEYRQYTQKTRNYSGDKWNELAGEMGEIFAEFATCVKCGAAADSAEAQRLVKKLQNHITEYYYSCTDEILAGLGRMYVADERFRCNIDQYADGTAVFVERAIESYCERNKT